MADKHEYWMYRFEGAVYANGPIDKNKPVSEKEIRAYIKKRYECGDDKFEVWPTVPWWVADSNSTTTEIATSLHNDLQELGVWK